MNRTYIISLGIGLLFLSQAHAESSFEQARLSIGTIADTLLGGENASEETQQRVKELCEKMGIRHSIPVKKMNTVAKLLFGYENIGVLVPGLLDRMYVNEKWMQEELTPEERNFLVSQKLAHTKRQDGLTLHGISLLNALRLGLIYYWLGPQTSKLWRFTKAYALHKLLGMPLDLLAAKYYRHEEKEADFEAVHTGNSPQSGIDLLKKIRDRSLQPNDPWDRKISTNLRWLTSSISSLPFLKYYSTQPSLDERIAYLAEIQEQTSAHKPKLEEQEKAS